MELKYNLHDLTDAKCPITYAIFTTSGEFQVPCGVRLVRVLVVGGGAGGGSGNAAGGNSGFVRGAERRVVPGEVIPVTAGSGGRGSSFKTNNASQDATPGGRSSFGDILADGGKSQVEDNCSAGGSGGGAGCEGPCRSGDGGKDGSPGRGPPSNSTHCFGSGQIYLAPGLLLFKSNILRSGDGGQGVFGENPGGGGGGGLLVNGKGPVAEPGLGGAFGGRGYGAGGGAGSLSSQDDTSHRNYTSGGNGAAGLVYIEWWWPPTEHELLIEPGDPADISCKNMF